MKRKIETFILIAAIALVAVLAFSEMQYNYFYPGKQWKEFDFVTVIKAEVEASEITVKNKYNGTFWMATSGDTATATVNFSAQVLGNDKTLLDAIIASH